MIKTSIRTLFILISCLVVCMVFTIGSGLGQTIPEELDPLIKSDQSLKKAYLTFDDGPSINTMKILDILDRYQIKATFFVMGNKEAYAEKSYREIVARGHSIALHSYSHDYNVIYRSKKDFFQDLKRLELLLSAEYGVKTHFVRLPGGSGNQLMYRAATRPIIKGILQELKDTGYVYVDWNVDSKDGISPLTSQQTITQNVLSNAKHHKQAIILLHDINSMKNTVKALPTIIEGLKEEGYIFDIIDETTPQIQFN